MSTETPDDPSKPLVDAAADADQAHERLEAAARLVLSTARERRDLTQPAVKFAKFADRFGGLPKPVLDLQVGALRREAVSARTLEHAMRETLGLYVASGTAAHNTVVASVTSAAVLDFCVRMPEMQAAHAALVSSHNAVLGRGKLAARVRESMLRLRLDHAADSETSPVKYLEEAQALIVLGDEESPLGAFIALRSAITESLKALLRRAPDQEPTGGLAKSIVSIGRRCSKAGLPDASFERLQEEWAILNGQLSDGKSARLPRQDTLIIFHNGLLFLRALLEAIEEALLKPVS